MQEGQEYWKSLHVFKNKHISWEMMTVIIWDVMWCGLVGMFWLCTEYCYQQQDGGDSALLEVGIFQAVHTSFRPRSHSVRWLGKFNNIWREILNFVLNKSEAWKLWRGEGFCVMGRGTVTWSKSRVLSGKNKIKMSLSKINAEFP
jgi:hypothetical protein